MSKRKKSDRERDAVSNNIWQQLKAGKCPNCGEKGPHFVPPGLGSDGMYTCKAKS